MRIHQREVDGKLTKLIAIAIEAAKPIVINLCDVTAVAKSRRMSARGSGREHTAQSNT